MPQHYPFSAVVGSDDMALALILTAVSPSVGGVLIRGEKGTAKSTMVRALTGVLPPIDVVSGDRFSSSPDDRGTETPDGRIPADATVEQRPVRLVELPIGVSETASRVTTSGECAQRRRDRLRARPARARPPRPAVRGRGQPPARPRGGPPPGRRRDGPGDRGAQDGVSVDHAALRAIGTMNRRRASSGPSCWTDSASPEVAAPRDPELRAEVVRRRIAFEIRPAGFVQGSPPTRPRWPSGSSPRASWSTRADVAVGTGHHRGSAPVRRGRHARRHRHRPHRRRARRLAGPGADHARGHPGRRAHGATPPPSAPHSMRRAWTRTCWRGCWATTTGPTPIPTAIRTPGPRIGREPGRPAGRGRGPPRRTPEEAAADDAAPWRLGDRRDGAAERAPRRRHESGAAQNRGTRAGDDAGDRTTPPCGQTLHPVRADAPRRGRAADPGTVAAAADPVPDAPAVRRGHRPRRGRPTLAGVDQLGPPHRIGRLHRLRPALRTIRAAARWQPGRGRSGGRLLLASEDLRSAVREGRGSNLVLFCVDASGSMAARTRMEQVKTAILSLLLDAYRRRDTVGLVTFRGSGAEVALPPTSSVDIAATRLAQLPAGGRTPLAEGLLEAAEVVRRERVRDPLRRALVVVVTDGRATHGPDALARSRAAAAGLASMGTTSVVVDCETGRFRMGLAAELAEHLGAEHVPLGEVTPRGSPHPLRPHPFTPRNEVA